MTVLAEYENKYETVSVQREDGILQVTFHSGDGSLLWGEAAHRELGYAFADIGADPENKVVILTGTGDDYCANFEPNRPTRRMPKDWDKTYWEGKRLLINLLEIEVPVIGAVNGPATIHAEIPVMSDIVLASETATFQDGPHFPRGVVPGDGFTSSGLCCWAKPGTLLPAHRTDALGAGGAQPGSGGRGAAQGPITAPRLGTCAPTGGAAPADSALQPRRPHPANEAADAGYAGVRAGHRRTGGG